MKKKVLIFFVGVFFISLLSLNAQIFLTLKGGLSNFNGEGSEYLKSGYNMSAEFAYKFERNIILGIGVNYNKYKLDDEKLLQSYGLSGRGVYVGGNEKVTGIYAITRSYFYNRENLSFYLQVSAGYFSVEVYEQMNYLGTPLYEYNDSDSRFGSEFSAGLTFGTNKVKFVITPSFFVIKNYSFFVISAGVQLSFNKTKK